jgi:hypothetical protein
MKNSVFGISASAPRLTRAAALLVATALSVPVFVALTVIDRVF